MKIVIGQEELLTIISNHFNNHPDVTIEVEPSDIKLLLYKSDGSELRSRKLNYREIELKVEVII